MNISQFLSGNIISSGIPSIPVASFLYNRKIIKLIPAEMKVVSEAPEATGSSVTSAGAGIGTGGNVRLVRYGAVYEQGLAVTLDIRIFEEFQASDWVFSFANESCDDTYNISDISALDILYPAACDEKLEWKSINGDKCGGESYMPVGSIIRQGGPVRIFPRGGRPSNQCFPFFDICGHEDGMICAIGWSGQWEYGISRTEEGVSIKAGLQDADFYLKPGETARTPRILIMPWEGDRDFAHNRFRKLMMNHFSPKSRLGDSFRMPASVQDFCRYVWFSRDFPEWSTEEGQLNGVSIAAGLKYVDAFWIDALWFEGDFPYGVGNYSFKKGFPHGMKPVSDAVHKNSMKFILWFEPERISEGTELFELNPDWLILLPYMDDSWEETIGKSDNRQKLFNLGVPAAREWLTSFIAGFIEKNGIDIYRQDFNMDPLPFWRFADEKGRKGLTEIKYVEGHYKFWDDLLGRFPELLIDNCASGGRRFDLETCSRAVTLWRSDTGSAPRTDEMPKDLWNQNQVTGLTGYIPYHSINTWGTDLYEFRSAVTMGVTVEFDILSASFDETRAKAWLAEFRRLREYWEGDYYPLTEASLDKRHWSAYQLNLNRNGSGMAMFFRRDESPYGCAAFKLKGLAPDGNYKLTFTDENMEQSIAYELGKKLMDGYDFVIKNKRNSLLVEYFAV